MGSRRTIEEGIAEADSRGQRALAWLNAHAQSIENKSEFAPYVVVRLKDGGICSGISLLDAAEHGMKMTRVPQEEGTT